MFVAHKRRYFGVFVEAKNGETVYITLKKRGGESPL